MYEGSLCVCCMATDDLLDLFTPKLDDDTYAKMINTCFNIEISPDDGHDSICESCTSQLKDCVSFKEKTIKSLAILSSMHDTVLNDDAEVPELPAEKPDDGNADEEDVSMEVEWLEDDNDETNPMPQEISPKLAKTKRKVGRPRIHPTDTIPYKIGKDEVKCRECGEEFANNVTLKVHYNSHFGAHVCRTCGKGFVTHQSLVKHEKVHLKGPFPCTQCGQEFRTLNSLSSHKRFKHSSAPRHRCRLCARVFPTLTHKVAHEASEHGVKSEYPCKYCGKKFMLSGVRATHIAEKHEQKLFPCIICGVKFKRGYMRAHLLRRHKIGKGVQCPMCPCVQPTKWSMEQHLKSHLDDRRHVCKLCGKAFVQKVSLRVHIGSHVRRGEYSGDPDNLLVHRSKGEKHNGMLSDIEDEEEESSMNDEEEKEDEESIELQDSDCIDDVLLDDERFLLSDCDI